MQGKTVLVTGGSRGIGRATVLALAQMGAQVAFTYQSNQEAADEVVALTGRTDGSVLALQADVRDFARARQVLEEVQQRLGDLYGLVQRQRVTAGACFLAHYLADGAGNDYEYEQNRSIHGCYRPWSIQVFAAQTNALPRWSSEASFSDVE